MKDRFTILSQQVLLELRAYYLIYKPKEYLFNGSGIGRKMSVRNIQHPDSENTGTNWSCK